MSVKFSVLSDVLINNKDKTVFHEYIKKQFDLSDASFELHRKFVDQFVINHKVRWQTKSKFRPAYFKKHYETWLNQTFELPIVTLKDGVRKDFLECSERTQKRRGKQLCQEKSAEEIELAFISNLKQTDQTGVQIVKSLSLANSETKQQVLELLRGNFKFEVPYTPNEALALFVDLKSTRHKYELLRSQALTRNSDLYPPYYKVAQAKQGCYPIGNIDISDLGVRIPLQSLLDHTAQRLIETCDASLFVSVSKSGLEMISKWGMDGASGQSAYKQIFKDDLGNCSDNRVFMISMVPLRIKSSVDTLWTNPHPSSTRLSRPISFEFIKEKEETTNEKFRNVEVQIENLKPTIINVGETRVRLHHKLFITMIDGKSVGYLSSTSDCNCCICGAKPSEMSNIEKIRSKSCAKENYQLGLSSLHCRIRFLECILHIAFKLPIKKWKAKTVEEKALVEENKKRIQQIFKTEKGKW